MLSLSCPPLRSTRRAVASVAPIRLEHGATAAAHHLVRLHQPQHWRLGFVLPVIVVERPPDYTEAAQQLEVRSLKFYGAPHFPSVHIDAHIKVGEKMTLAETLAYMQERIGQAEEAAVEIVLRTLQVVGPKIGRQLLEESGFASWGLCIPAERLEVEMMRGQARRKRMSIMARDAERTLGRASRHEDADRALELLTASATS